MKSVNWAILSTGWIANEFCTALKTVPNANVVAVASRDARSAEKFAEKYGIEKHYGSYQALVEDPSVDIVYIGTPNGMHSENVYMCLEANKHVLCEKPLGLNSYEVDSMVKAARSRKLFLMEAMWTRFFPAVIQAKQWLMDRLIGEIKLIKAEFSSTESFMEKKWLWTPEMHGGSLYDAGIYPVSVASFFAGVQPSEVTSLSVSSRSGVDEFVTIGFTYSFGIASLACTLSLNSDSSAYLCGTKGYIHIPYFLNADKAILHVHGKEEVIFNEPYTGNGYQYEAQAVTDCLIDGLLESPAMPLDESLEISKTMDRIRNCWQ